MEGETMKEEEFDSLIYNKYFSAEEDQDYYLTIDHWSKEEILFKNNKKFVLQLHIIKVNDTEVNIVWNTSDRELIKKLRLIIIDNQRKDNQFIVLYVKKNNRQYTINDLTEIKNIVWKKK